jgi:redox-sensing transcriptional repressor
MLITTMERIFTQAEIHNILIVGMGNIGSAFARHNWFMQRNINIVATFDIDPVKQRKKTEFTIYAMDRLKEIVYRFEVRVAIIAVPEISAQEVCDQLVEVGIKGVLNFAPVILKAPREVIINNVNLFDEVESVFYQVEYVMRKERE